MRRTRQAVLAVAAITLLSGISTPVRATSAAAAAAPSIETSPTGTDSHLGISTEMAAALRRDLKLDDGQLAARLRAEAAAPVVARRLKAGLGGTFAGAWIPAGGVRLTVAVTTPSSFAAVRAEGATPVLKQHSSADLTRTRQALDGYAKHAKPGVIEGWYVDVPENQVVILAAPGGEAAASAFVKASGAGSVTVRTGTGQPRTMYDIRGGDQYVINGNVLCSVGFAVSGGFVSAGHCGTAGASTLGYNNVAQGTFAGSSFPGNDYSFIRTNGDWTPQPWVNNYAGGNVLVAGSQDAAIGSSICRSGRTSGWHCGTLLGRDETVVYAQGSVSGLSRSNACAEPGDSGGAWISGNQAQGVTSGGSGNCTSGGTMWFQPVNEILQAYGLTLTTTGGAGSAGAVVSNWNGRCIDVPNSNFSDGVPLQMWDCNGTGAQKWTFVNGTLQSSNNKCMDVAWGSTANGAVIQIAGCSGNAAQQFVLSAAGDLVNPQANKCIDIKDWNGNAGAALQLWDCAGTANQKWHRG